MTEEELRKIYEEANTVFGGGIVVKCASSHPCGWDWISFSNFDGPHEFLEHPIGIHQISGGCYENHDYEDMTVRDVIEFTGEEYGDGWAYELGHLKGI